MNGVCYWSFCLNNDSGVNARESRTVHILPVADVLQVTRRLLSAQVGLGLVRLEPGVSVPPQFGARGHAARRGAPHHFPFYTPEGPHTSSLGLNPTVSAAPQVRFPRPWVRFEVQMRLRAAPRGCAADRASLRSGKTGERMKDGGVVVTCARLRETGASEHFRFKCVQQDAHGAGLRSSSILFMAWARGGLVALT